MQGLRRTFLKVKPNKELDKSMVEITIYPYIPLHIPTHIYIYILIGQGEEEETQVWIMGGG